MPTGPIHAEGSGKSCKNSFLAHRPAVPRRRCTAHEDNCKTLGLLRTDPHDPRRGSKHSRFRTSAHPIHDKNKRTSCTTHFLRMARHRVAFRAVTSPTCSNKGGLKTQEVQVCRCVDMYFTGMLERMLPQMFAYAGGASGIP